MTIIAYRDGLMAADTAVWSGERLCGHMEKVVISPNGTMAGACGNTGAIRVFLDHIASDRSLADFVTDEDNFTGWVVSSSGSFFVTDKGITPVTGDFFADGSGADFAIGAMAAGASAEEAVRITMEHHSHAGGEITIVGKGEEDAR